MAFVSLLECERGSIPTLSLLFTTVSLALLAVPVGWGLPLRATSLFIAVSAGRTCSPCQSLSASAPVLSGDPQNVVVTSDDMAGPGGHGKDDDPLLFFLGCGPHWKQMVGRNAHAFSLVHMVCV